MTPQQATVNAFLVDVFNDILRLEDASLHHVCNNLSVTELHVLEAVEKATAKSSNSMADIAAMLGVTAGTLTASVKTLETKGYLTREKQGTDKRRVSVVLLPAAAPVLAHHTAFHEQLVTQAIAPLSAEELQTLAATLGSLHAYFKNISL